MRRECLGRERSVFCQEKSEKVRSESRLNLKYKTQLDGSKILSRICRALNLDRNECVKVLSRICRQKNSPRWIENLSRSYRADKMLRTFARWIKEAVKNISRRNLEISMDRESVKVSMETKERKPDRNESIGDLSRSYRA